MLFKGYLFLKALRNCCQVFKNEPLGLNNVNCTLFDKQTGINVWLVISNHLHLYCVFHGIRFKVKKKGCRDDNSLYF